MPDEFTLVSPVALPVSCSVAHLYGTLNLADAYTIRLPLTASRDPEVLARFLFAQQPAWVGKLMMVRDAIVAGFGLKTGKHLATLANDGKARRVGIFKIYSVGESEIVLGEDDQHLDFRVSVLCSGGPAPGSNRQLTVSTVVHCHNLLGRTYILIIAPIHRAVVKASLRRAARIGWPKGA